MNAMLTRLGLITFAVAAIAGFGATAALAEPPPDNPNKACPTPHPGVGIPPFCTESAPAAPAAGGGGGGAVVLLVLDEGPRGIWCVGNSPLILVNTGGFTKTFAPGVAVDLVITQGKAVEAQGLVTPAFFVPGVGAVCSGHLGVTYVANQPLTKVNNLGQSVPPGDDGAIYVLGHKA